MMNNVLSGMPDLFTNSGSNQFRLATIQLFNWGTFDGVVDFVIPDEGFLLVGPSGSGKSTVLDAHAAIMTPPKWASFNVAAREAELHGKDRNYITYIRGAWSQQTGESGEFVSQYLRPDTTWSAIAETYRHGDGRVVVLCQVFWVRGKSTSSRDVKRLYLVMQREFNVRELKGFPESDFDVRRLKNGLPDDFVKEEFSVYQERFRQLLGIDNERALRLLHKTQSAKNLGDLNQFLRDFMLDEPETFELADKLVSQFQELNEAHQHVVTARRQRDTLIPAREEAHLLDAAKLAKNELDELLVGLESYLEQRKAALLEGAISEKSAEIAGAAGVVQQAADVEGNASAKLQQLRDKRRDLGGNLIEQLGQDIIKAEEQKDARLGKRGLAQRAFQELDWSYPNEPVAFAHYAEEAKQRVLAAAEWRQGQEEQKFKLRQDIQQRDNEIREIKAEIEAMERQRSNIPARMLGIRENLAQALHIPEEDLPFAGELIEVKAEEGEWQGAIERVLRGFALSLLVSDKHYSAVSSYLNKTHIGERLVYFKATLPTQVSRPIGPNSLVRKLDFAKGPYSEWLRDELKAHFDYECVDSIQAFKTSTRALTREGLVKHSASRHEKNDANRVDDKSKWVLGFDNASKLALYRERGQALVDVYLDLQQQYGKLDETGKRQERQLQQCQTLANITWAEVDVDSVLLRIQSLNLQLQEEKKARPDLETLDAEIKLQNAVHDDAKGKHTDAKAKLNARQTERDGLVGRLSKLRDDLLDLRLTPHQQEILDRRFQSINKPQSWDTIEGISNLVERGINLESAAHVKAINEHTNNIERCFHVFITAWPAEAGGLDPTIESAPDFFNKLTRIERDGLPDYEERFLRLLHEQSDQNLTRLSTQLEQERKAIRDRMDLVNESLETAPFNPGTYLVIETMDRQLEDVKVFKQGLKEVLSHSFQSDPEGAERRFETLNALVKRFSSQETIDRNWRALVLDVRQHVEFVARELDAGGLEVDVYRSGAGKSGGQRQKLTSTCLAAALRYQLGGQYRDLPMYSTVVLDEAFDKADSEFTQTAMNIFKTFGFQMIVATPLKSVMTLEPFIGGACFVHIKDRKKSAVIPIEYDETSRKLILNTDIKDDEEATIP
jgi:uncharacterized protein YPO0396